MSEVAPPAPDEGVPADGKREEPARRQAGRVGRPRRWRAVISAVLVIAGCLLAPLSLVAVWSNNQISDTDRYVANVAPLATTPSVQSAVAARVSEVIDRQIDVAGILDQTVAALEQRGLPARTGERLKGLAGPLDQAVHRFVQDAADGVVRGKEFPELWERANRAVHTRLDAVLSGDGGRVVRVQGDTVSVDLGPVIDRVKQRLVDNGLTIAGSLPEAHPTFELFRSEGLVRAQRAYSALNTVAWVLPVLSVVLLGLGVWPARDRRRALLGAALGVAGAMMILAAGLSIGRAAFLDTVAGPDPAAAGDIYDVIVRFVRDGLRIVLVLALLVAAAMYLIGPGSGAVRIRSLVRRAGAPVFSR